MRKLPGLLIRMLPQDARHVAAGLATGFISVLTPVDRSRYSGDLSGIPYHAKIRSLAHHFCWINVNSQHLPSALWLPLPAHHLQFQATASPNQQVAGAVVAR